MEPAVVDLAPAPVPAGLIAFDCVGSVKASIDCHPRTGSADVADGISAAIIGGQNVFVTLTSSNVQYDAATSEFTFDVDLALARFDVTIRNLLSEAIGTADGLAPDARGIRTFFHREPTATAGSGAISVANADGMDTFTAADQPFFRYAEMLGSGEVSGDRTWVLSVPATVETFSFTVLLDAEVEYRLVINEVMTNPEGTLDNYSEWFELYNAGSLPVNMEGLLVADSAASGRRPYHRIAEPLIIAPGGYVVLGNSMDPTLNGGAPVDYAYGSALVLANSLDAVKVARVVGTDTVTVDRAQYNSAAISAKSGISRELLDPALDNWNMDSANWKDADVTAVYGPGGRGTPRAPNSGT